MPLIEINGIIEIDDDEYDPGTSGPLTQEAYERYTSAIQSKVSVDDLTFTFADDQ